MAFKTVLTQTVLLVFYLSIVSTIEGEFSINNICQQRTVK